MRKHGKYNPDYNKLYPDTEISEEITKTFETSDRKMRYMEVELKREKFVYNPDDKTARLVSGREDSYDRLCDVEHREFPASGPTPEEELIRKDEAQRLHTALEQLTPEELDLITKLFFEGLSEREYGNLAGMPQRTVHDWKVRIQKKLKNLLEK